MPDAGSLEPELSSYEARAEEIRHLLGQVLQQRHLLESRYSRVKTTFSLVEMGMSLCEERLLEEGSETRRNMIACLQDLNESASSWNYLEEQKLLVTDEPRKALVAKLLAGKQEDVVVRWQALLKADCLAGVLRSSTAEGKVS